MSELSYYVGALKRFRWSKMGNYFLTIPDRVRMHKYYRYIKESEKNNAGYTVVCGGG